MLALTKQLVSGVIMADSILSSKTCNKCGISQPLSNFAKRRNSTDGHRNACKSCTSDFQKQYRKDNFEKIKCSKENWRLNNMDRVRELSAIWRDKNRDKLKVITATYRAKNKEVLRIRSINWYNNNKQTAKKSRDTWNAKNIERKKAMNAAWIAANPDKLRIRCANRRFRKINAGGVLSANLSKKLFKLQKGKCACCGQPLGRNYHLDHIMPLALGGSNTDDNIQLLRQRCNQQKGSKNPIDFMQSRGFLL